MSVPRDWLLFELSLLIVIPLLALLVPGPAAALMRTILAGCARLARRPALACGACALLAAGGAAAFALGIEHPVPRVHDEFAYLLTADTFAHGRLTNPTHPHWEHFETFHVSHQPSYFAKYPPGSAVLMAAGQALTGDPLVGVWLAVAAMGAAICWLLLAWLPPRWAVLGGLLAVWQYGLVTYWAQSYWGGALAAAGGALAFGGVARLLKTPRASSAALTALGLALLANTRPYEGLVVSLPLALMLLAAWQRHWSARDARRVVAPLLGILTLTALCMAIYNAALTGDVWTMPYQVHDRAYVATPAFLWSERPATPTWRHAEIEAFWTGFGAEGYEHWRTPAGFLDGVGFSARLVWRFHVGVVLALALLPLRRVLARPWARLAALGCVLAFGATLLTSYRMAHYVAPATGLLAALLTAGLRQLAAWQPRKRFGRALVGTLLVAVMGLTAAQTLAFARWTELRQRSWAHERARVQQRLEEQGGRHLLIVRYAAGHDPHQEWVHNGADLDTAPVLWARDLPDSNAELVAHDPERVAWFLDVDGPHTILAPFAGPADTDVKPGG